MNGFWLTVDVDDNFTETLFVPALPPIGAMMNIRSRGTFKVKEIEFQGTTSTPNGGSPDPTKIVVRCVPVLAF